MPARYRRLLLTRVLPGVLGVEGVGDAPVGGIGLPVDAVPWIFTMIATPCPAQRATSVAGTPEFSQSETAAQVVGRRPTGDRCWAG